MPKTITSTAKTNTQAEAEAEAEQTQVPTPNELITRGRFVKVSWDDTPVRDWWVVIEPIEPNGEFRAVNPMRGSTFDRTRIIHISHVVEVGPTWDWVVNNFYSIGV